MFAGECNHSEKRNSIRWRERSIMYALGRLYGHRTNAWQSIRLTASNPLAGLPLRSLGLTLYDKIGLAKQPNFDYFFAPVGQRGRTGSLPYIPCLT